MLADAGDGNGMAFRTTISERGLQYAVGIESSTTIGESGRQPLPAPARKLGSWGVSPKRLQRSADHPPSSVKELALALPHKAWKDISGHQGSREALRSRFAAVRVRPAHRDDQRTEPTQRNGS